MRQESSIKTTTQCFHCGDDCLHEEIKSDGKIFCCTGCKMVFEILKTNELGNYYELESKPGISPKSKSDKKFSYLDHLSIQEELLDFQNEEISKVQLYLPQIHCSSCLWLLENLFKLNPAIKESRVNFLKKEAYITFDHRELKLRELAELLSKIGYEPNISLDHLKSERKKPLSRRLLYQVGLAGFAFGNIMLFSLPEYFGSNEESYRELSSWFSWLNLILATPVAFYSGQDYFKSAWGSIKRKQLNIDVPIALGVIALYLRSSYEVITQSGAGYFDSLCGLLFFLLLGRLFQEKVYHQLSFERDYRSYFPISLQKLVAGKEESVPVQEIKKGDKIVIRNGELIPVDAYLIKGLALIDNSFATGESEAVEVSLGSKLYAGGRQKGEAIELEVIRPLSQSKLTRLWSEYASRDTEKTGQLSFSALTDQISHWFTPIILIIALGAGLFHLKDGIGEAISVMSAVLIVACPCALALAAPFTYGHAMRYLGRVKCYLREASVVEKMAQLNHLVFDKTGTLTHSKEHEVKYEGSPLDSIELENIYAILNQSNHPLSRSLARHIKQSSNRELKDFKEIPGKGLEAEIDHKIYRLGSLSWVGLKQDYGDMSSVALSIDGEVRGVFLFAYQYRKGLKELIQRLQNKFNLSLISGDKAGQKQILQSFFPATSSLRFEQSPKDKVEYIKSLQSKGEKCMMIGDGLNDAAALQQSEVGVSISEDINTFSPACDIILSADEFNHLDQFLAFGRSCRQIVIISFVISFLYNLLGLSFAVQGLLSPVFAAILMPISSISVVGFVSLACWIKAPKFKS